MENGAHSTNISWTVHVAGEGAPIWWGNITHGTVLAWGTNDLGQTNIPPGLSNVVAIAAGAAHSLALLSTGSVVAWGANNSGQTNVPASVTNAIAISAGGNQSLALKNDGTVVQWGQTNVAPPASLTNVAAIASGTNFHLALLSNSTGDRTHGQTNTPALKQVKIIASAGYQSMASLFSPLVEHTVDATKDLLLVYNSNSIDSSNVASYYLQHRPVAAGASVLGVACTNNEAIRPGYFTTNTNYYFDDVLHIGDNVGAKARDSVIQSGIAATNVTYVSSGAHITSATNVAGYMTWGTNGGQSKDYVLNGDVVFIGNSSWYIIMTVESFNGQRCDPGQGTFLKWFSSNAFGGTNYSNTPIGAATHVMEPSLSGVIDSGRYFGLWVQNKNFALCAWNSLNTVLFQAVGDPFVRR